MGSFLKARCPVCGRYAHEKWWRRRITHEFSVLRQTVTSEGRGKIRNESERASATERKGLNLIIKDRIQLVETPEE